MVAKKKSGPEAAAKPRRDRRAPPPPLEVKLTVAYKFGSDPDDVVTLMNDRRIPMVNSVFENRDRILRGFVFGLLKAGTSRPKVLGELMPAWKLLKKLRGRA